MILDSFLQLRKATWFGVVLLAIPTCCFAVEVPEPNETVKVDCGVNALYVLLVLEGHNATLEQLTTALPARHPEGYSMAELAKASSTFGLELEGIRFAKGDKPPLRPIIAFLKDVRGGHFAVLRPVGTTGTMVQVLDPPNAPWIGDYTQVMTAKPWTGRVLTPRAPWLSRNGLPILLAAAGIIAIVFGLFGKRLTATGTSINLSRA